MSLSFLNNFELCYRGTSFKVQGGSVISALFLAHNYVSKQFGNYVEYGIPKLSSFLAVIFSRVLLSKSHRNKTVP